MSKDKTYLGNDQEAVHHEEVHAYHDYAYRGLEDDPDLSANNNMNKDNRMKLRTHIS